MVFVLNNLIAQSFTLKDMRHFSWLGKCDYDKMVKKGFTLTAENLTILYLHYEFENKKTQEQVVIDSDCRFLYDGITAWKTAYYTNSKPEYDKFSVFVKIK